MLGTAMRAMGRLLGTTAIWGIMLIGILLVLAGAVTDIYLSAEGPDQWGQPMTRSTIGYIITYGLGPLAIILSGALCYLRAHNGELHGSR
tara:strand:- start:221 stop:490 length:270 start_codon:yes stop_codon:yes gene_type:complete